MYDPSIIARTMPGVAPAAVPTERYVIEHPNGDDLLITDMHVIRHIATTMGGVRIIEVREGGIIIETTASDAIGLQRRLWQMIPNIRVRLLAASGGSWDAHDVDPDNPDR